MFQFNYNISYMTLADVKSMKVKVVSFDLMFYTIYLQRIL